MFENPRRGREARNFTENDPKILDLKSLSEQIMFRKLSLGAPDENHTGYGLCSHTTTVAAACVGAISVTKQSCAALISKGHVGTGRFPTTIFSTTQRCIVGTML